MVKHWLELGIFIACLIFGAYVSSLLLGFCGVSVNDSPIQVNGYIVATILTQTVMFVGAVISFFLITKLDWKSYISINSIDKKQLIQTALFFSVAFLIALGFSQLAGPIESYFEGHSWLVHQHQITKSQNEVMGSLRGVKIGLALLFFAVLPAIAEELVFRGILYKILKDLSSRKHLAMILSAFIFAIFHFQILSFLPIFVVGYLLAYLYDKTGNIATGMLLHFLFNAIQIVFWQA
ncbi:MAG: lysostaphin resistance A-like protein [Crocinitomicaceae bacterium]